MNKNLNKSFLRSNMTYHHKSVSCEFVEGNAIKNICISLNPQNQDVLYPVQINIDYMFDNEDFLSVSDKQSSVVKITPKIMA